MRKHIPAILLPALLTLTSVSAETVATDPVGRVNITLKGSSDTVVSVPLAPNPSYSGAVSSAASAGSNLFNLNVNGTTGWTADQFAGLYYVRMTSGARAGMYYTITANTTGQVTVDTAGDDLSGIAANDTFKIFKYWTLGTLFPPASAGTAANPLTASTDLTQANRKSQVLLPDNASAGTNLPLSTPYFFTSTGWVSSASGNPAANDTILWPDSYFVVRQASIATDATWSAVGSVVMSKLLIPLTTQSNQSQDNYVSINRPTDVKLSELGLESGFVESTGLSTSQRRDTLLVFNNATAGYNKSASKIYFRYNGAWRSAGGSAPIANDDTIPAGSGLVVRKYQTPGATTAFWSNTATY